MPRGDDILFASANAQILVRCDVEGRQKAEGRWEDHVVRQAHAVSPRRCILLLDPDGAPASTFRNLLLISHAGELVWRADLPGNPDHFVEFTVKGESLFGSTFGGHLVVLRISNGALIRTEFVK